MLLDMGPKICYGEIERYYDRYLFFHLPHVESKQIQRGYPA